MHSQCLFARNYDSAPGFLGTQAKLDVEFPIGAGQDGDQSDCESADELQNQENR